MLRGRRHVFHQFLFAHLFFLPETGISRHYCDNLFVAVLVPFSYEDKRLAQHWTLTHPLTSGMHDTKHAYVQNADILNTCGKLLCVDKQRNSIPQWTFTVFNRFCITLNRIITLRAKLSGAVYCCRSCLCACNGRAGGVCLCVCVCGSVTTITRNCVHRSSPNWVCR